MIEIILAFIAALSLITLGIFAIVKQRTTVNAAFLFCVVLLAGMELCDQLSFQLLVRFDTFRAISLSLESLLPFSFLCLSLAFGRNKPFVTLSKVRIALLASGALFPMILLFFTSDNFYYSPDFQAERVLFLGSAGYWYYIGIMVSFILSLMNIEVTFTATTGLDRYRMKFETFGLISILAVLVFYYSQGLLFRTINMNLVPIRSSVFIISALLIGYSRVFRGNGVPVSVSRKVLYRSVTLLVVGFYLIVLGIIGEGMRYFAFGRDVTIFFAFAGGIAMLTLLFSESMRRKAKVYISKHFYTHKHDYREEWIKLTSRLASCETLFDVRESVLTAYRESFGLKGASLYLLSPGQERYFLAAGQDMPERPTEINLSEGLYSYFVKRARVLNLRDGEYRLSPSEENAFLQAGATIAVPLISNGEIVGLIMLGEQIVFEELNYDDYDMMKVLARQAAQAIANFRLSEELMEARAMAAVARISSFVIHDLKNLTTGLSLLVDNAQEHMGNPDFQQDLITTVRNTLSKMKNLMQRLKSIPEKITLESRVEDIGFLSREMVEGFTKSRPGTRILYEGLPVSARIDREEIGKVIVNLVQNALEAGNEQTIVTVETHKENGKACVRVTDTGNGMTEDFMKNYLFKPFRTTKEKGLGIGLYQCKQIVEAHGGKLEASSTLGKGSVFSIFLPVADDQKDS